uniref:G-protein coupled receptors family 1 profile domain-containing protein n=1 Tax=Plectus sambesii TaxID=2011161 RepID=A0A914W647_9BILA
MLNFNGIPDPDPESAIWLGKLYALYGAIGIPANLIVLLLTLTSEKLRAIPMNICILSITFADLMVLVAFLSSTFWAMSFDPMICKVMGVGIYIFDVMTLLLPACLAVCRYVAICSEQTLHPRLRVLKKRKGIIILNGIFWAYGLTFTIPLIITDRFGLGDIGICGVTDINSIGLWIYYMVVVVGALFGAYVVMFIFYRRLGNWVKTTSSMMVMSSRTRETLNGTRNLMRMLRWLLFLPMVVYYPALTIEALLRIVPRAVSTRTARYFLITVPLAHVLDPIATIIFVKSYRTALLKSFGRPRKIGFQSSPADPGTIQSAAAASPIFEIKKTLKTPTYGNSLKPSEHHLPGQMAH